MRQQSPYQSLAFSGAVMIVCLGFLFCEGKAQSSESQVLPSPLPMEYDSHSSFFRNAAESLPSDFPVIAVTTINTPAPGNLYLTNFKYTTDQYGTYLMILDSYGHVLFERSTIGGAQDFTLQPIGIYTYFDNAAKKFYGLDSNFVLVDSFAAANGYETDGHELRVLPDGGYMLFGVYTDTVDMTHYSGQSNANVIFNVLQEFDRNKNLLFEWRTQDHFAITDAVNEDLTARTIDAVHCNAIELDQDGSILLSSRSLDEITKINREDGSIIWRLGGKHSQFTFTNDTIPFSHQHDLRRMSNGNFTVFDNGNSYNIPNQFSRAVEYSIDENAKTITKIWEFRHHPDYFVPAMGSVQRLSNGNTLIGWGICDSVAITEVKPDNSIALEMGLPLGHYNYRVYKYTAEEVEAILAKSGVSSKGVSMSLSLDQNYPNPFSASSTIHFVTNKHSQVSLILYDALGREVKTLFNGDVEAGDYTSKFDAGNLPSGAYIYKLTTPTGSLSRTMIIAK